jgi:hypothetical protein
MVLNSNRHELIGHLFRHSVRSGMFIETGTKQNFAVKRSGMDDRVNASSRFPLLLTAPEVFVCRGYKHSTPNGVAGCHLVHSATLRGRAPLAPFPTARFEQVESTARLPPSLLRHSTLSHSCNGECDASRRQAEGTSDRYSVPCAIADGQDSTHDLMSRVERWPCAIAHGTE